MFNLQGHRGARGMAPENTLASFQCALDVGVSSVETDLHLSDDGIVVLSHDPAVGDPPRLISQTPIADLRLTTLDDLCKLVSPRPPVIIDLEIKRVPGRPQFVNGPLEERLLECVQRHDLLTRTVVRSFDHRCLAAIKQQEPKLRIGVLIANTAPLAPEELCRMVGATMYCPDAAFVDETIIGRLHAANVEVVPWTVNEPTHWEQLLAWGVDGITTDYPDRLAEWLRARGVDF